MIELAEVRIRVGERKDYGGNAFEELGEAAAGIAAEKNAGSCCHEREAVEAQLISHLEFSQSLPNLLIKN